MEKFLQSSNTIWQIIVRNIKLFLKDKMTVFFSLLAPLIILMLYVLFLRDVQIDGLTSSFTAQGLDIADKSIKALLDGWLVAGMVSVCCITVALNSMMVMVSDRQNKILQDFTASPLKPILYTIANFLSFFIITIAISVIVMILGMAFMAISSGFYMSILDILGAIGTLILSCLSSVMILMSVISLFKTVSSVGAFSGIISAMIGFIIGAYMPINTFALPVQFFTNIVPGSHSAAIFRTLFMDGALQNLVVGLPLETASTLVETLRNMYSFELFWFDFKLEPYFMILYLTLSVVVFFVINWLLFRKKKI